MHAGKGRLRASEGLGGVQGGTTNPIVQREQASARQPGIGGRCEGNRGASAAGEGWVKGNHEWSGDSEWNTSILVLFTRSKSHDGTRHARTIGIHGLRAGLSRIDKGPIRKVACVQNPR